MGNGAAPTSVSTRARPRLYAAHSCIAIAPDMAGGYNQTDWWGSAPAVTNGYSRHFTSQLRWGTGSTRDMVGRFQAWYELFEIREPAARALIRRWFQPGV
jgi:hypothetical protein